MPRVFELWDELVSCICRPPRDDSYSVEELPGGSSGEWYDGRWRAKRTDIVLTNKKGLKLQCSHLVPLHVKGKDGKLPCVIYCHCNSGSRRDADEAVPVLIPSGISLFSMDFAGSGLSEGKYVTLGAHEVEDVEVAVDYLRKSGKVSTLGLWGRSMGAVTALMYSARDPSIAGIVLDSPFARLTALMDEIVEEQQLPVPKVLMKGAVMMMRNSVKKRAGFDIQQVAPLEIVPSAFIPALFGHATGDTFVRLHHSEQLHAAYGGDKNLIKLEGDHNSRRPVFFYQSVNIFFHNVLQLDSMLEGGNPLASEVEARIARMSELLPPDQPPDELRSHAAPPLQRRHSHIAGVTEVPWQLGQVREHAAQGTGVLEGPGEEGDGDDEDEAALREAIRLSLLEVSKEQGSGQQQQQQSSSSSSGRVQANGSQDQPQQQQQQLPVSTPAFCLREPLTIQGGPQVSSGLGVKRAPPPQLWTSQNGSQPLEPQQHKSALIPTPTGPQRQQASHMRPPWDSGPPPSRFQRTAVTPPEYLAPDSAEDEEEQLRRALALSLQDAPGGTASSSGGAAPVAGAGSAAANTNTSSSHHRRHGSEPSRPVSGRAGQQHHSSPLAAGALGQLLSRSRLGGSTGSAGRGGEGTTGAPAGRGSEYEVTMRREAVSAGGPPPANMVDLLCQELGDGLAVQQQQQQQQK